MRDLLFDPAWWYLALLILIGVVMVVTGNSRLEKRLSFLGLACFALAGIWFGVALIVETDKENVGRNIKRIVTAVEKRNQAEMRLLLHNDVQLGMWNKTDIVAATKSYPDQFGINGVNIVATDIKQSGPIITSVMSVVSHQDSNALPVTSLPTTWQLDWKNDGEGWQLLNVELTQVGQGGGADLVSREFQRKPVGR